MVCAICVELTSDWAAASLTFAAEFGDARRGLVQLRDHLPQASDHVFERLGQAVPIGPGRHLAGQVARCDAVGQGRQLLHVLANARERLRQSPEITVSGKVRPVQFTQVTHGNVRSLIDHHLDRSRDRVR